MTERKPPEQITKPRNWSAAETAWLSFLPEAEAAAALGRTIKACRQRRSKTSGSGGQGRQLSKARWTALATQAAIDARLSPKKMLSGRRFTPYVRLRWGLWDQLYKEGYSLPGIGAGAGYDHTTIMAGIRRLTEVKEALGG